jgi:hypothetical protein
MIERVIPNYASSAATTAEFASNQQATIARGCTFAGTAPAAGSTLVVPNLTPIDSDPRNHFEGDLSGSSFKIFLPENYDLMNWFLFA